MGGYQYKNGKSVSGGRGFRQRLPFLILKEMRIHQWVKNILVFLPFILAHEWDAAEKWISAVYAFFSFSLVASSVYIVNDIRDREADRRHPVKKHRPIASGALSLRAGWMTAPLLLLAGLSFGWFLVSPELAGVLLLYGLLTSGYTFYLKRKVMLDVLILAGLYTLRLYGGAVATEVVISEWLLGFSLFFFLSLALIKRYAELLSREREEDGMKSSRGYEAGDLNLLMVVGISSGLISVLVFALYLSGEAVRQMYARPFLLWLAAPVLIYWVTRMWTVAIRGNMHSDPVVFAVRDWVSVICGVLILALVFLSN